MSEILNWDEFANSEPSLSFDTVEVNAVRGQSGLIHSSQLMFNVHEDHSSGVSTCEVPQDVIPPDDSLVVPSS